MEFDVASIKLNKLEGRPASNFPLGPGAMYSPNGGRFSATGFPLSVYIMFAYKMTDHQVEALEKQLPAWAREQRYDIEAKTDKRDATKDEMRLMMQSLLAECAKLAIHLTKEDVPVYALTLARPGKLGPKLRPHPSDGPACSPDLPRPEAMPNEPQVTAGGFPVICGGLAAMPGSGPGLIALGYRNASLSLIALQMTGFGGLDRPVMDQTGLTGKFDLVLEFTPDRGPESASTDGDPGGPTFRQALAVQTGLKLVAQKGRVDSIVLDHLERPSAN